ncbi:MAG: ribokinase [Ignisphaera sp.]
MSIAVVGSIHADFYVKVKRFPQPDETVIGSDYAIYPGGKGANQAVGCARLGVETYMIGAVGDDYIGSMLIDNLARNGVRIDYVYKASCSSGVAFIILNEETRENMIIVSPGADNAVTPQLVEDSLKSLRGKAKILLTQLEIPIETVYRSLEIAKEFGILTILNPAPARSLDRDMFRFVDIAVPNRVELQQLTGVKIESIEDVFRASEKLLEWGVEVVITTLGSRGAAIATRNTKTIAKAFKVPVVDTTGAGDAFVAGLAVALLENREITDAVRFANAVAALKITRMGAQSMPTRSEVDHLVKNYETQLVEVEASVGLRDLMSVG